MSSARGRFSGDRWEVLSSALLVALVGIMRNELSAVWERISDFFVHLQPYAKNKMQSFVS